MPPSMGMAPMGVPPNGMQQAPLGAHLPPPRFGGPGAMPPQAQGLPPGQSMPPRFGMPPGPQMNGMPPHPQSAQPLNHPNQSQTLGQLRPPAPGQHPGQPPMHAGMPPPGPPMGGMPPGMPPGGQAQGMGFPGQQQQQQPGNNRQKIFDVLREKHVVQPDGWWIPEPDNGFAERISGRRPPNERRSCAPEIMRATINACPETPKLLKNCKLPFGLLMQPFKDIGQLSVVTTHKEIVRCKSCRMYICPFVTFIDQHRWRCNICHKQNDVPQHFFQVLQDQQPPQQQIQYTYPENRPEINHSTIEYIAPPQYTTRAPPPVRYLYLIDVSHAALQTKYLEALSESLLENLEQIKSRHDKRMQIGFIAFDAHLHFFEVNPEKKTVRQLTIPDFGETEKDLQLDELLPACPENLLITVNDYEETIRHFITSLPTLFRQNPSNAGRALGPAIKAATKLLASTGGRTTCFIGGLPTNGVGKLSQRDNSNRVDPKSGKVANMHAVIDTYKQIALDCNGNQQNSIQMAVDTFFIANSYCDMSTVSNVSRWSSGSIFYYPGMHKEHDTVMFTKFRKDLDRYLTRKIGFEAVLRIRATIGLKIQQFHGNAFVRGEDILSLANVNPDAGFAVNLELEEDLDRFPFATLQAALLYTNSMGERRVRVHTLALPIVKRVDELYHNADGRACVGLLSQMAVDRAMEYSIKDARTALMYATTDSSKTFREHCNGAGNQLILPKYMLPMPLYVHCLGRHPALTDACPTALDTLDARIFAMCQLKQRPVEQSLLEIYPSMYRVDHLDRQPDHTPSEKQSSSGSETSSEYEMDWETPDFLSLTAENISSQGIYLLDIGDNLILWVGQHVPTEVMKKIFNKTFPNELKEAEHEIPEIAESSANQRLLEFIESLRNSYHRPFYAPLRIVRDDTSFRHFFINKLMHDRIRDGKSYYEFLTQVRNDIMQ